MKAKTPPLSLKGDLKKEEEVRNKLLDMGISIESYEEDISIAPLGYKAKNNKNSNQIILNRPTSISDLSKRDRKKYEKYQSLLEEEIVVSIQDEYTEDLRDLYLRWSADRFGKNIGGFDFAKEISPYFPLRVIIHRNKHTLKPIHFRGVIIHKNTAIGIHKIGMTRHLYPRLNFQMISDLETFNYLKYIDRINAGSCRSKGNLHAKTRIPFKTKKLCRVTPLRELDKKTWEEYRPQTNMFF